MLEQIISAVVAGLVSIIGVIVFWLCSRIRTKALQSEVNGLKQAFANSGKLYYVECENCHNRIYLSQAKIEVSEDNTVQDNASLLKEFKTVLDNAIEQFEKKNKMEE